VGELRSWPPGVAKLSAHLAELEDRAEIVDDPERLAEIRSAIHATAARLEQAKAAVLAAEAVA
jgi:hypothetical protein